MLRQDGRRREEGEVQKRSEQDIRAPQPSPDRLMGRLRIVFQVVSGIVAVFAAFLLSYLITTYFYDWTGTHPRSPSDEMNLISKLQ
jgi:hypothetical protein